MPNREQEPRVTQVVSVSLMPDAAARLRDEADSLSTSTGLVSVSSIVEGAVVVLAAGGTCADEIRAAARAIGNRRGGAMPGAGRPISK
jgi:hypothetical protein